MKRYALIFLVAIFLPSLILGWLALRTAGEQQVLIERQAAGLHQAETDVLAAGARSAIEEKQREFAEIVRALAADRSASALAETYGRTLAGSWPNGGVPFAISPKGILACPTAAQGRENAPVSDFLRDNAEFLTNEAVAEIYQVPAPSQGKDAKNLQYLDAVKLNAPAEEAAVAPRKTKGALSRQGEQQQQSFRNIMPQKPEAAAPPETPSLSKVAAEVSDFQSAVGEAREGALARFVQDHLQVLFWTRPDPGSTWLFGVMLGPAELARLIEDVLPADTGESVRLAILNDRARPVARSPAGFSADWKRPFVATEIGEILPHWEVALYLTNPGQLAESARLVAITLVLLITLALAAILAGGYFVALDTRRQLAIAQKKTDFVSNVSHELKTPLTSIRMFSELLADDRVREPEKRRQYLRIIAAESERLARLVNNVLDFARMEKSRKTYDMRPADAFPVIERIWETERSRLEAAGFALEWSAAPGPYPVVCDSDAMAQILVNLIANAEKYSPGRKEILLATRLEGIDLVITIADRGTGVPPSLREKIFDAFFRANDSLASGVQGSGLGLTLARRLARDHGGDVTFIQREGGGSTFTLRIPLDQNSRE